MVKSMVIKTTEKASIQTSLFHDVAGHSLCRSLDTFTVNSSSAFVAKSCVFILLDYAERMTLPGGESCEIQVCFILYYAHHIKFSQSIVTLGV